VSIRGQKEDFQHGGQSGMKEKHTGGSSVKGASDWKRVRSMSDRQIRLALASDPEARPTDAKFWQKARVVMPEAKKPITNPAGCGSSRMAAKTEGLSNAN
jgi:hypothetical protein